MTIELRLERANDFKLEYFGEQHFKNPKEVTNFMGD